MKDKMMEIQELSITNLLYFFFKKFKLIIFFSVICFTIVEVVFLMVFALTTDKIFFFFKYNYVELFFLKIYNPYYLSGILVIMFLCSQICGLIGDCLIAKIEPNSEYSVRMFFAQYFCNNAENGQQIGISFFLKNSASFIENSIDLTTEAISQIISIFAQKFISYLIVILFAMINLYYFNWKFMIFTLIEFILFSFLYVFFSIRNKKLAKQQAIFAGKRTEKFVEVLNNITLNKSLNLEDFCYERINKEHIQETYFFSRFLYGTSILNFVCGISSAIYFFIILYTFFKLTLLNLINFESIASIIVFVNFFIFYLWSLSRELVDVIQNFGEIQLILDKLNDDVLEKSENSNLQKNPSEIEQILCYKQNDIVNLDHQKVKIILVLLAHNFKDKNIHIDDIIESNQILNKTIEDLIENIIKKMTLNLKNLNKCDKLNMKRLKIMHNNSCSLNDIFDIFATVDNYIDYNILFDFLRILHQNFPVGNESFILISHILELSEKFLTLNLDLNKFCLDYKLPNDFFDNLHLHTNDFIYKIFIDHFATVELNNNHEEQQEKPAQELIQNFTEQKIGEKINEFKITGKIIINNLTLSYSKDKSKSLIKDFSINIEAGEKIAIIGQSGTGKSTFLYQLMGFDKNERGAIKYDNMDINDLNLKILRDQISYVSQKNMTFHGTIYENILIGKLDATKEEIFEAARKAEIHDDIMDLENQYESMVNILSGGQLQRVCLSRFFLKQNPILLLDEAFSALDPENKAKIIETTWKYAANKTILFITHSIDDLLNIHFDKLILLESSSNWSSDLPFNIIHTHPFYLSYYRNLYESLEDFFIKLENRQL